MSTRANVVIEAKGLDWDEEVQLYRHGDGYPTAVLPSLAKAYEMTGGSWEAGRPGKVAGYICAASYIPPRKVGDLQLGPFMPYEPEPGGELHSDVAWLYRLILINHRDGDTHERPTW